MKANKPNFNIVPSLTMLHQLYKELINLGMTAIKYDLPLQAKEKVNLAVQEF